MARIHRTRFLLFLLIAAAMVIAGGLIAYEMRPRKATSLTTAPAPSSRPAATQPATMPAAPAKVDKSYLDVVRSEIPQIATTQPLAVPLDLGQAARLVLPDPIYLDKVRGDLWITRSDAPPIQQALRDAADPGTDVQTHVIDRRLVFVHWKLNDNGSWVPFLICPKEGGGFEVVSTQTIQPFLSNREFLWERAFSWDGKLVVPSRDGISVFEFASGVSESFFKLLDQSSGKNVPQALPDWQGILAWAPWEEGKEGSHGAVRFVDGKWLRLGPEQGWPEKIVHLVPLRDGTVFQFVSSEGRAIALQSTKLDQAPVDQKAIEALVDQLSDVDQEVRKKAFADLANFGPGAWPTLQRLSNDQSPQARLLIRQLLKDQTRPTLSGMTLLGNRQLQLVNRTSDGGVIFYAEQGVSIPQEDEQEETTAPAYLSVRPGHFVELLPAALTIDYKVGGGTIDAIADQWVVDSDVRGPRLFYGNGFATLLRKDERAFRHPVGIDRLGRWLFRKPTRALDSSQTRPSRQETLIIDPHLPDPTPRLPVWQLAIAQTVGWDKDNWPVIENGSAYALMQSDWRALAKDERFFTRADQIAPTTGPATRAATRPATGPSGSEPLLIAPDGTQYFGGLTDLRTVLPDGREIIWPLPPAATGSGPASLIRDASGRLFLFNQQGRVLRIAPSPGEAEPFKLEAAFTHNIPSVARFTRIWLDPAGRIDLEWEDHLAILFPDGYIPRGILEKMIDQNGLDADEQ